MDVAPVTLAGTAGRTTCRRSRSCAPTWPARPSPFCEAGHPHQRHLPRTDQHATGPGPTGDTRRHGWGSAPTIGGSSGSKASTPHGHRGDAGTGTAAQHHVDHAHQLVHLHQRAGQQAAGLPDRMELGGMRSGSHPLMNSVIDGPSPPAQSPTTTRVNPTAGMLGPPRLDQLLERRLAGGVGAQAGPRGGERGAHRGEVGGHAPPRR
jgi:hypothetical protein